MLGRQLDEQIAISRRRRPCRHNKPAVRSTRKRRDPTLDLSRVAHAKGDQFHPECGRDRLDGSHLADPGRDGGIAKDSHLRDARRDLFKDLQPFSASAVIE